MRTTVKLPRKVKKELKRQLSKMTFYKPKKIRILKTCKTFGFKGDDLSSGVFKSIEVMSFTTLDKVEYRSLKWVHKLLQQLN